MRKLSSATVTNGDTARIEKLEAEKARLVGQLAEANDMLADALLTASRAQEESRELRYQLGIAVYLLEERRSTILVLNNLWCGSLTALDLQRQITLGLMNKASGEQNKNRLLSAQVQRLERAFEAARNELKETNKRHTRKLFIRNVRDSLRRRFSLAGWALAIPAIIILAPSDVDTRLDAAWKATNAAIATSQTNGETGIVTVINAFNAANAAFDRDPAPFDFVTVNPQQHYPVSYYFTGTTALTFENLVKAVTGEGAEAEGIWKHGKNLIAKTLEKPNEKGTPTITPVNMLTLLHGIGSTQGGEKYLELAGQLAVGLHESGFHNTIVERALADAALLAASNNEWGDFGQYFTRMNDTATRANTATKFGAQRPSSMSSNIDANNTSNP